MRLIDADALLEYLMINMGWQDEDGREVDDSDKKRAIIKDLIDGVPTLDAVPVVHGRWVFGVDSETGEQDLKAWTCSECNEKYPWQPNYCPNCGAKMDREVMSE